MTDLAVPAIACVLFGMLAFAFKVFSEADRARRVAEDELEAARLQTAALQGKVEAIRRWRHDAQGLLQAMEYSLAAGGAGGQALASGGGSGQVLAAAPLVQSIVQLKVDQCAQHSIAFDVHACEEWEALVARAGVGEADVAALVQNLLENAYEANLKIPNEADRGMSLVVAHHPEGALSFEVCNRIDPSQYTGFLSRKNPFELHGVGLRIVDDIAKAHHGMKTVEVDHDSNTLTTIVRFVLPV